MLLENGEPVFRAWSGPENLPTVDELSRPLDWLARVHA